jgi:hypothetical protein
VTTFSDATSNYCRFTGRVVKRDPDIVVLPVGDVGAGGRRLRSTAVARLRA